MPIHLRPLPQTERADQGARTFAQSDAGDAEIHALIRGIPIAPTEIELAVAGIVTLVEQVERAEVRIAGDPQIAAATAIFLAAEHVVHAGIERRLPGDVVEARVGVEVPHVKEVAQIEVCALHVRIGDNRRRTVEVQTSAGYRIIALALLGLHVE